MAWDEKNRVALVGRVVTNFSRPNHEKNHLTGMQTTAVGKTGMDGWIRVWYYESIDQADPPDDDRFLQIDPIYEFEIKEADSEDWEESSMLMCIMKQYPDDPERTLWYAQVSVVFNEANDRSTVTIQFFFFPGWKRRFVVDGSRYVRKSKAAEETSDLPRRTDKVYGRRHLELLRRDLRARRSSSYLQLFNEETYNGSQI